MKPRLDPYVVSPKEMQELISFQDCRGAAGVETSLIELLRARVSQLHCAGRAMRRHMRRAAALGETRDRLSSLARWRDSHIFTDKERAALGWAEVVTCGAHHLAADDAFAGVTQWFTDVEIVQLTVISAAMDAWNRVEMSFSRELADTGDMGLD